MSTLRLVSSLAVAAVTFVSACGNDREAPHDGPDPRSELTFDQCDGSPDAFVRQAFLALAGRRPHGQAEVDVYKDLYTAASAIGDDPRATVARAIMQRPEFLERWVDVVMDALHVQRLDIQSESDCWGDTLRMPVTPALAQTIRDQPATGTGDGKIWTMLDLARSAITLDDVTPIYRAQMFSLVSHPIPAANVGEVEAELARREDFGAAFDAGYLHRDVVCLGCHTSETSVTDDETEALDRHWPVPGAPESLVFGTASPLKAEQAHAPFRVDDFVDAGNVRPWGWAGRCGQFGSPVGVREDIANVDAKLAGITGKRATVYDLEASLRRGFTALRGTGVNGPLSDPDAALAWLVTLKITEDVWKQTTGTSLTIANYFPRNRASSELLHRLANELARSNYSLKTLLVAIVTSDYFDRLPPEAECGASPYTYPPVFDPWVTADADAARRNNGPGDAITAVDIRTLFSAAAGALDWGTTIGARFPYFGDQCGDVTSCNNLENACDSGFCCQTYEAVCKQGSEFPTIEVPFQRSVGVFLRNSERGFRGLDFQARLAWENRYGACARPRWVMQDFIDRLQVSAAADPTATVRDAVLALKDRVTGEAVLDDPAEEAALAAIMGPLDAPGSAVTSVNLRKVCGALLESPQFLMQGLAGRGGERPKLTPTNAGYDAVCAALAASGIGVPGRTVSCAPALTLLVARSRVERVQ